MLSEQDRPYLMALLGKEACGKANGSESIQGGKNRKAGEAVNTEGEVNAEQRMNTKKE